MKPKEILVFGASGQIGRNLIRKLTKNNFKVIAVTRNIHQKGYVLKTQANPGYLEVIELDRLNEEKIKDLFNSCSVCINLIGILYEKNKNQFNKIHSQLPHLLSKLAKEKKIDQFIHVSALGVENAIDSDYAKSKFDGENFVKKNFKSSVILKPSIVYSIDDNFTTSFMTLLNRLPIMPLYYNGDTKFFPIHVSDLTEIIFQTIVNEIKSETIECIGPEELSFKEIIKKLLKAIDKKRLLIPVPLPIAKISAFLLGLLPKPLLTSDQLRLLKYNNVPSNKYKTNFDLGFKANKKFEIEIEKYSYNWRSGGEYTRIAGVIFITVLVITGKAISRGIEAKQNQKNISNDENSDLNEANLATNNTNSNTTISDQINDLNKLKEQGALTEEEFKKAKEKILN